MQHELNHLGQQIGLPVPDWKPPPFPSRQPMHGRFCCIEPLDPAKHGQQLFDANALEAEGRSWTYLPYGPFDSLDDYMTWLSQSASTSDPLFFAFVDSMTGKAVGIGSYLRIDPRHGSIEVGHLNFSPLLQRRPAATEAMYLMMKYAFGLGYRRYEWKCNALNWPSRRAAQRLGLSFEGVFRQAAVYKGRNRDTAWYAAIDEEWPQLQRAFLRWLNPSNFDENGAQRSSLASMTVEVLKHQG